MLLCLDQPAGKTRAKTPCKKETRDLRSDPVDSEEIEGWVISRGHGMSPKAIAEEAGVNLRRVERGLRDFDDGKIPRKPSSTPPPQVEILFPNGPLTPSSRCPHDGPIPKGEKVYCSVCDACGLDGIHPHLTRVSAKDPALEPDPEIATPSKLVDLDPTIARRAGHEAALIKRTLRRGFGRTTAAPAPVGRRPHHTIAA